MSLLTELDKVQTFDDICEGAHYTSRMYEVTDDMYLRNVVGFYFLLDTPEKRAEFRALNNEKTRPIHRKISQVIDTFESAELPDPEPLTLVKGTHSNVVVNKKTVLTQIVSFLDAHSLDVYTAYDINDVFASATRTIPTMTLYMLELYTQN